MNSACGRDLLDTFNNLEINTGSVSQLTIDAWFNTDCEATKELLQWLHTYLGKENVLTAHENEEYEQLLEKGLLLNNKQYESDLLEVQSKFPGILDYEENLFEIDCLEDELKMLLEEECHLEQLLKINELLNTKLFKETKICSDEEIMWTVKMNAAKKKCLEWSYILDNILEKLQQQIDRYAKHLNKFEYATTPTFISHMPTKMYDQYCSTINSLLEPFLHKEYESFDVTSRSIKKDLQDNSLSSHLEKLQQRIFKSMMRYFNKQLEKEKLCAELKFLNEFSVEDFDLSLSLTDCSCFALKTKILQKEESLKIYLEDLGSIARHQTDAHLETPKLSLAKSILNSNQNRLKMLIKVDAKVLEILTKHMLLHSFLKKENEDIKATDKFFRDVHSYIISNLHSCHLRTENMAEVIDRYRIYNNAPLEERLKITKVIKTLVVHQPQTADLKIMDIIMNFKNEYCQLEQQVFFKDYVEHRRCSQEIEHNIAIMRKFLIAGPTSQMCIIPRELMDNFEKLNELREMQECQLKAAVQVFNYAKEKLEDKWFCTKRQLWMWFLLEPKRVLNAIEQIEATVRQKRHEAI